MRDILKKEIQMALPGKAYVIYDLLCAYYDGEIFRGIEIDDIESEIYLPLDRRPSGILEALEKLMPMEKNINDESDLTPLSMSVINLDFYMTEYLIEHGANPNFWFEREEDILEHKELGIPIHNYYLEDIDIRILLGLDFSKELVVNNVMKMIKIILEYEGVESFFGVCLSANKTHREIKINSLRCKY